MGFRCHHRVLALVDGLADDDELVVPWKEEYRQAFVTFEDTPGAQPVPLPLRWREEVRDCIAETSAGLSDEAVHVQRWKDLRPNVLEVSWR